MAQKRSVVKDGKDPASGKTAKTADEFRTVREVVESLAVALVLAFFFKMFLIELFVIPTGSMAPTLMGYHKDVLCTTCGYEFTFNASDEFPEATGRGQRDPEPANNPRILAGTCPQCGFTMYVDKDNAARKDYRSYPGDRILVSKYNSLFRDPARWDVTVFRYPGHARISYIKRLIGLENETVRIRHGDIFVRKEGDTEFKIQRKPERALNAMLQSVYDNDYAVPAHHESGWARRWAMEFPRDQRTGGSWFHSKDIKSFMSEGACANRREEDLRADSLSQLLGEEWGDWLEYAHRIPSSRDCWDLAQGRKPQAGAAPPRLITDYTAYNSGLAANVPNRRRLSDMIIPREIERDGKTVKEYFCRRDPESIGHNWVGDLAVSCELACSTVKVNVADDPAVTDTSKGDTPPPETPVFQLRLVKGGRVFLCSIDLSTGLATLSIPGIDAFQPVSAPTSVRRTGSYQLRFANIDEQMRLWVDGKEIAFEGGADYDHLCEGPDAPLPRDRSPTELDLWPVGLRAIGLRTGSVVTRVTVSRLKVMRDLYYIAMTPESRDTCDLLRSPFRPAFSAADAERTSTDILSNPVYWSDFGKTRSVEFTLGKDQFLMLGDNSACSLDSRLWTETGIPCHVSRDLLIGEAVLVYWPHGLPIPYVPLNLIPNFPQMRLID